MHQRRETSELEPADQELRRTALDQPVAEVPPDVVGPVREPAACRAEGRCDQNPQRPEIRRLIAGPGVTGRVLSGPATSSEQDTSAGVDLIESPLHALAVEATKRPRSLRSRAPVRQAHVVGDVIALTVIGLDPFDAPGEDLLGLLPPPRLGARAGEVNRRAGAHPPLADKRPVILITDEVTGCGTGT